MYSKTHTVSSVLFFSIITVLLTSFGLTDEAFAAFTPTQPNAYVSYDNSTNQIQLEWDFTTGGVNAPETCLLKGDFWYYTDLNNAHGTDQANSDDSNHQYYDHVTLITGFIPIHYSVISSNPTISGPDKTTEVIPCEGSSRIDLDTVMSHESNVFQDGVTPRQDLQIFLSFYALDANTSVTLETFDHQSTTYMDQIFVAYTPDVTWNTGFKNYACAGEPGNVLYLDASASDGSVIAHGNNGDNCNQYLYLENNEYVDIGGANNAASLTDGETFYDDHVESTFSLLYLVVEPSTGGGSGCNDCIDSTFYYSQHRIIVENGFVYNGYSTDVIAEHTETPPLITNINQTNVMKLKVYDNFGTDAIKWVDVGFGLPGLKSSFDKAEVTIEIRLDNNVVKELKIHDPHNLVDFGDITSNVVDCGYVEENCLQVTIPHSFRDKLVNDMIVIRASDYQPNEKIHYFNEGLSIVGNPLDAPTDKVFIQKYLGNPDFEWVDIVRVDRSNDIWASEDGLEFTSSYGGGYLRITQMGIHPNLE